MCEEYSIAALLLCGHLGTRFQLHHIKIFIIIIFFFVDFLTSQGSKSWIVLNCSLTNHNNLEKKRGNPLLHNKHISVIILRNKNLKWIQVTQTALSKKRLKKLLQCSIEEEKSQGDGSQIRYHELLSTEVDIIRS